MEAEHVNAALVRTSLRNVLAYHAIHSWEEVINLFPAINTGDAPRNEFFGGLDPDLFLTGETQEPALPEGPQTRASDGPLPGGSSSKSYPNNVLHHRALRFGEEDGWFISWRYHTIDSL
jgi:hypothetical protein